MITHPLSSTPRTTLILTPILQSPILCLPHSEILGQESERGTAHKLKPKSLPTSHRSGLDIWSSWSHLCNFPALDKVLQSHLLMPSLLYRMSYNYIPLHIVTFPSLTHYYFHAYPPLLFLFVLIILTQPRLRHYVSWYLTMIDLCTHLRDCHLLYNSEVCFLCFCLQHITPILTNPGDMINYM